MGGRYIRAPMRRKSLTVITVLGWLALATASIPAGTRTSVAAPIETASTSWIIPGDVPLADGAESVEILREDEALSITPGGARRGLVALGVRLPILGSLHGPGCIGRWVLVGPLAYVCADKVKLSAEPPGVSESIHPTPTDGLPYRYFFVGADGADAYGKLADFDDDTPTEQLDKGWAIATVKEVPYHGQTFLVTRRGRFVPRNEIGPVAPNPFHGEVLVRGPGEAPNVGWVLGEKATVFADAKSTAKSVGSRVRLQHVDVFERKLVGKESWLRVGEGQWMKERDVRAPTATTPPEGVVGDERWIDIDTGNQTLVTYEGTRPVFATVVSTGRAGSPTPKGTFKIWVKLRSATMSNADDESETTEDSPAYSIEDVPWVQYFSNGVAIHGAFWHRRFGFAHSHGCVNLAPLDAMRMFEWTLPRSPRGWDAVFPTVAEPATIVRVR